MVNQDLVRKSENIPFNKWFLDKTPLKKMTLDLDSSVITR